MSDEFIYPEGINADALKQLFEEAYMEVSVDTDGDVIVKDNYRCYLRPDPDGRLISTYAIFGAADAAVDPDKMAYVNRVNDQVKCRSAPRFPRTASSSCDYYLSVERRCVEALHRAVGADASCSCLSSALREDTANVVA